MIPHNFMILFPFYNCVWEIWNTQFCNVFQISMHTELQTWFFMQYTNRYNNRITHHVINPNIPCHWFLSICMQVSFSRPHIVETPKLGIYCHLSIVWWSGYDFIWIWIYVYLISHDVFTLTRLTSMWVWSGSLFCQLMWLRDISEIAVKHDL